MRATAFPRRCLRATALAAAFLLSPASAFAMQIIRDAETESVIREVAEPLFRHAGFDREQIAVYIVQDDEINAYVSGGKNIFLNTGLLLFDEDVAVVAGVIAHELGHIRGGHLARQQEKAKDFTAGAAFGYILGLATGVVAGPAAGTAVFSASQQVLQREFLKGGRGREEEADQTATELMASAGYSSDGLLKLLGHLRTRELSSPEKIDPYAISHPLSAERIEHIRSAKAREGGKGKGTPKRTADAYRFVHAKLTGFLDDPEHVAARYRPGGISDNAGTVYGAYGSAVAYFRQSRLDESFALLDALLKEQPKNPFFLELKAQFLLESGRIAEAASYYKQAAALLPEEMLLQAQYGAALVAGAAPGTGAKQLREAARLLEDARYRGERSRFILRELGVAYGKLGDAGTSNLYLAEWAAEGKAKKDALTFLTLAKPHLKAGSPAFSKWQDVRDAVEEIKD
jgi:predicted Zn-dependent protease